MPRLLIATLVLDVFMISFTKHCRPPTRPPFFKLYIAISQAGHI